MICSKCGTDMKFSPKNVVIDSGKCESCYAEEQPLIKMPGGSYLPWELMHRVQPGGEIYSGRFVEENEDTTPIYKDMVDRRVPQITFCHQKGKWKLTYLGIDCDVNDGVVKMERYFDTKEEILELMTKE